MRSASVFCGLAAVAAVSAEPSLERRATSSSSGSLPAVSVQGNAFFANGQRFYIRGVDYQPGGSSEAEDPLADQAGCDRDIPVFQELGLNTIRVYTVDNTKSHDYCMSKLAAAGIYVALDVNTPLYSLNRADPAPSYNAAYLQSIFATMDAFASYSNTLLFFSGNEVINAPNNTNTAPYIKAVTRDMKLYRDSRGMRKIPVGYSAADVDTNRFESATYLNCGPDCQRSDFFAFNDYSWCSPSSFTTSGWSQKVKQYASYGIPLFLSEYGCVVTKRDFSEVKALYSSEMTGVYSGGLVYEYSNEGNGYGIMQISGNSVSAVVQQGENQQDALMAAFKGTPAPSGDGGYNQNGQASQCPAESDDWQLGKPFAGTTDLPAFPEQAMNYLKNGAGKGPGLAGDGSQNSGDGKVAIASPACNPTTAVYATATTAKGGASSTATKSGAASAVVLGPASYGALYTICAMMLSAFMGALLL